MCIHKGMGRKKGKGKWKEGEEEVRDGSIQFTCHYSLSIYRLD